MTVGSQLNSITLNQKVGYVLELFFFMVNFLMLVYYSKAMLHEYVRGWVNAACTVKVL